MQSAECIIQNTSRPTFFPAIAIIVPLPSFASRY